MSTKKNRLGRGLDDLVSPKGLDKLLPGIPAESESEIGRPLMVKVEDLDHNPDQPRRDFNEKELASLSQSIKAKGIIEPLVVSKKEGGRYEIVAGERRLKAAKMVNLTQIPVIITENIKDPSDRLVLALLENLCREDLNPMEEAESFSRLEKDFGKTHQEIATLTGRERPTITNAVRLLRLPDYIQDDIRFGRLSAGHGRALLPLADPTRLRELRTEIIAKNLSVRQAELFVKRLNRRSPEKPDPQSGDEAYFEALAGSFSKQLGGLKVRIIHKGPQKKVEVLYRSNEDLEGLMVRLGVEPV